MTQVSVTRIEVSDHRQVKPVRLLNFNTLETVDPNKPVECSEPQASNFLKKMLPLGMIVRLGYDYDTQDSYVRDLAAVFLQDFLVNANIVRNGWT